MRSARAGAELPLRVRVGGRLCRDGGAIRNSRYAALTVAGVRR